MDELLWTPSMTPALRDRLVRLDISWVTDRDEIHIHTPWGLIANAHESDRAVQPVSNERSFSPGALITLQYLIETPTPVTQHTIAHAVGLSQPRMSQVLRELVPAGLAQRVTGGWVTPDPGEAFNTWLAAPRRPEDVTEHWFSLDPLRDQLMRLTVRAREARAALRLCGDWAADVIAPWRRPGRIVVHADASLDLEPVAFVPSDPTGASLSVHIGPLWPGWRLNEQVAEALGAASSDPPLAPVTEIAREIQASGGSDAPEGLAGLRRVGLAPRSRGR